MYSIDKTDDCTTTTSTVSPSNNCTSNDEMQHYEQKFSGNIPTRHVLTILGFLGFFVIYSLRVNLSVALVAMVNNTAMQTNVTIIEECSTPPGISNSTFKYKKDGEFAWDENLQGIILAAFFYGYILTQVPGGRLAEQYSAKWLFGSGILWTSLLTILTPVVARWSVVAFIILRILEGIGEGITYPALNVMFARWIPLQERSTVISLVGTGANLGTVVTLPVAAVLCNCEFGEGWPTVFYLFGSFGILWFIFWILLIHDWPEEHPTILRREILYIQSNRQCITNYLKLTKVPWHRILTSVPLWALCFTKFCGNWGFSMLLTELPLYLSNVLQFPIKQNGYKNALLYIAETLTMTGSGVVSDYLRVKGYFRTTTIRKIFESILPFVGCDGTVAVYLFVFSMAFYGFSSGGDGPIALDMAPEFAGTVMGIVNAVTNVAGLFAPIVGGLLTEHNETLVQWSKVFYLAAGMYILGAMIFLLFGSAEVQPWAVIPEDSCTEPLNPQQDSHQE
ncbi:sialin-like isoform X2 [Tachypleus tridentatus]|uniref:sialin-like isoform X2 n=1 Tax=Tachypleus tridentatus TaxID=6853 RepID=UPI003FD15BB1